ncbi:PREDICTED: uncharacterized protein LOC107326879 [Paramuricea clavata]|uniref:PREDICTED: uncharacterized protein LOC107326879 n=1 Tax=Paramuricea clavata TaxID=317549 RepID=A0A7D9LVA6_PARCT|nr:PREDICTED: uncharacterized protein LOC107326879 [Paramuricea clavata]
MSTQLTPLKEYYKWKNGNFCCVCGDDKSGSRFTKIFSTAGKEKGLSEQIYSLTSIYLGESDGNAQSLKICRSCEGKLIKSHEFKSCAVATLESNREKTSSKRCLNFSPVKSDPPTGKRVNVEAELTTTNTESIDDVEVKSKKD